MLGILVGCILMTIAGCKEEQKRDPNFVVKSSSSSEINLYHTLTGSWVTQHTYSNSKTSTYSEILEFTKDGLCFCYTNANGQLNLIYTADYKYYSNLSRLELNDIIYSQFAIDNNMYYTDENNNRAQKGTLGCKVNGSRMIITFSSSETVYIKR